jgi:hypothetical protein
MACDHTCSDCQVLYPPYCSNTQSRGVQAAIGDSETVLRWLRLCWLQAKPAPSVKALKMQKLRLLASEDYAAETAEQQSGLSVSSVAQPGLMEDYSLRVRRREQRKQEMKLEAARVAVGDLASNF